MKSFTYHGPIMGKPRMTTADRWKKRPCVLRYWKQCDALREAAFGHGSCPQALAGPTTVDILICFSMPKSWSRKKRVATANTFHTQKPDADNAAKAILDALFTNDERVSKLNVTKMWGGYEAEEDSVLVEIYEPDPA